MERHRLCTAKTQDGMRQLRRQNGGKRQGRRAYLPAATNQRFTAAFRRANSTNAGADDDPSMCAPGSMPCYVCMSRRKKPSGAQALVSDKASIKRTG